LPRILINSVNFAPHFSSNLAEEIMSKVSNPISFILLATAVLPSGIDLSLQSARADDCLAAPNASEPMGQHWYDEIDQQKGRKCWYLHATIPRLHHAASRSKSHAALRRKSHAALRRKSHAALRRKSHAALRRKSHTVSTAVSAALTNMEPAAFGSLPQSSRAYSQACIFRRCWTLFLAIRLSDGAADQIAGALVISARTAHAPSRSRSGARLASLALH
jgi:hypothetical protein